MQLVHFAPSKDCSQLCHKYNICLIRRLNSRGYCLGHERSVLQRQGHWDIKDISLISGIQEVYSIPLRADSEESCFHFCVRSCIISLISSAWKLSAATISLPVYKELQNKECKSNHLAQHSTKFTLQTASSRPLLAESSASKVLCFCSLLWRLVGSR